MTHAEAVKKLKECQNNDDTEASHIDADDILCAFLWSLGYEDVVIEYNALFKKRTS